MSKKSTRRNMIIGIAVILIFLLLIGGFMLLRPAPLTIFGPFSIQWSYINSDKLIINSLGPNVELILDPIVIPVDTCEKYTELVDSLLEDSTPGPGHIQATGWTCSPGFAANNQLNAIAH